MVNQDPARQDRDLGWPCCPGSHISWDPHIIYVCKQQPNLIIFLYFLTEGLFQIPVGNLILPQPSRMMRGLDECFVRRLERDMEKMPEANYDTVFALCTATNTAKTELNNRNVGSYTYEVIGGAHSTTAAQRLHSKYPGNPHFSRRWCRIYVGLTDEEALWLGSFHNQSGGCRHQMTFVDEVL